MRDLAVFTIVQNEPVFLPLWLKYYTKQVNSPRDLYVLQHQPSDPEGQQSHDAAMCRAFSDNPSCGFLSVHCDESFNHAWLRDTVSAFQRFLLQGYVRVLFAEADEFVVADPRFKNLTDYANQMTSRMARCNGLNVVQEKDEPMLSFTSPILPQRRSAYSSAIYSKILLADRLLEWHLGFHTVAGFLNYPVDPELTLFHLHRADYGYCLQRHTEAAKRRWSKFDVESGFGAQNRICGKEEFDRWYWSGNDLGEKWVPIPDLLKTAF